jgi:replicative DNA helicase
MEMCVLGAMLRDQSVIPNITDAVCETDFFNQINREIFRAIIKLNHGGSRVDIISVHKEVGKDPAYIAKLTDTVPTGANWKYYADHVKRLSQTRDFIELIDECKNVNPETIEADITKFIERSIKVSDNQGGADIKTCREMMLGVINKLETAIRARGSISGLDTGFSGLNNILDGIQNEYIILGARASIGKTALAVNIAKNMVRKKISVGYFSLEMSGESLMMRMLSDETSVQSRILRSGLIGGEQIKTITRKGGDMAEYPLYVMDKTRGELTKIVSKCRYMVRVMGVKCIFIDHASLIRHPDRKMKRYEQFSEISNEIQALQRELNIPIILLAQLGRESEGKSPTLADLRESGGFEQDADTVILMHRERKLKDGERSIETDIDIAKNRNGACGVVKLLFFPEYIRFASIEKDRDNEPRN